MQGAFTFGLQRVVLSLTPSAVKVQRQPSACNSQCLGGSLPLTGELLHRQMHRCLLSSCADRTPLLPTVPFDEILSASQLQHSNVLGQQQHYLVLHTFKRSNRKRCLWRPHQIMLSSKVGLQSLEGVRSWAGEINAAIRQNPERPRKVLVLLNPYGGARKARGIWRDVVLPVFELAGIKCVTLETERLGHARQMIEDLTPDQLASCDGIVAVGGDGLFQESLNGLLLLRAKGGKTAELAARMRLGHIPAGSTDAVAYSINGTRSELTAALHVALGDRTPLDVMRIDTTDGQYRFAVCVASYGYMGDLLRMSERLRWLGPTRYNVAGAAVLVQGRAYKARVSWMPAAQRRNSVCSFRCSICASGEPHSHGNTAFMQPAAVNQAKWKTQEGTFKSIMAIVMPCRSDQSMLGLAPYSHLADGRIQLVLVHDCSPAQYLAFLASIPKSGVLADKFKYVELIDATAVSVTPIGSESHWNVDGELLDTNHVTAQVHRGLLEVFGRGVE